MTRHGQHPTGLHPNGLHPNGLHPTAGEDATSDPVAALGPDRPDR